MDMNQFQELVLQKFDQMDSRFDRLETRMDGLESRMDSLEAQSQETISIVRGLREHNEIVDAKLDALTMNTASAEAVKELKEHQIVLDKRTQLLNQRLFDVETAIAQ